MQTIKQYKTISILVFLIIVFGILAVFVKVFKIGAQTAPEIQVKNSTSLIPTQAPVADPFIHPENFNIPASYMGYTVAKVSNGDLGKGALEYGTKSATFGGTQWTVKKSGVSDIEYNQIKSMINSLIQSQLVSKGWKKTMKVNGLKITPNVPSSNNLGLGYVQVSDGKVQTAILEGNNKSGNVEFKLFLSKISNLKDL